MRATISFGLAGGALAMAGFFPFPLFPLEFVFFPVVGFAVPFLMRRGTKSAGQRIAAAALTTVGFAFTGAIAFFSFFSLDVNIEPLWSAFAWGLGFGIGGAISGQPLSRLWLPAGARSDKVPWAGVTAGIAFTFSGVIAGYLGFQGFSTWSRASLDLCIWLAYLLGGLLCDAVWYLSTDASSPSRSLTGDDSRSNDEQMVAQLESINRSLQWLPLRTATYSLAVAAALIAWTTGWRVLSEIDAAVSEAWKGLSGIRD